MNGNRRSRITVGHRRFRHAQRCLLTWFVVQFPLHKLCVIYMQHNATAAVLYFSGAKMYGALYVTQYSRGMEEIYSSNDDRSRKASSERTGDLLSRVRCMVDQVQLLFLLKISLHPIPAKDDNRPLVSRHDHRHCGIRTLRRHRMQRNKRMKCMKLLVHSLVMLLKRWG